MQRNLFVDALFLTFALVTSAFADTERWPNGNIQFELPEGVADSRHVETLPNGLQNQHFSVDLGGGECQIMLGTAVNLERMLAENPQLSAENRKSLQQAVEATRHVEGLEDEERNKALNAMALPSVVRRLKEKGYRERSREPFDATFSESGVPLGTTKFTVDGSAGPVVIWASASFVDMTAHLSIFEAPESHAEACAEIMESVLASFEVVEP